MASPNRGGDKELLADAEIVVEYGHSTSVEFFVADRLAAVMRFSLRAPCFDSDTKE